MYPSLNSTLMGNLTYLFTYTDSVTGGWTTPFICLAFFLVVFLGSATTQWKSIGSVKVPSSLLAASFVTTGFELILMQKVNNILLSVTLGITLAIAVLSFWWTAHETAEPQY